jgi:Cu-Zn family superoxide dismutase
MIDQTIQLMFQTMLSMPVACAHITGSSQIHNLVGDIYVYPILDGSLLVTDVQGIPFSGFYGFHIHQHGPCVMGEGYTGFHMWEAISARWKTPLTLITREIFRRSWPFTGMLLWCLQRPVQPQDILGRAIIIHEWPDDFRTQPTGDSGQHIGCGTFYPCAGICRLSPECPGPGRSRSFLPD